MAFHAQQSGNGKEQPPASLLFSPTLKGDGQKHSPLGRSTSITPPPFGTSHGFGGPSREQQTPPSRRRSLTPASSIAKDTPPPPPTSSLLDSPGVGGPSPFGGWAGAEHQTYGGGVEDMSTSPIGGSSANAMAQQNVGQPHVLGSAIGSEYAAAGRAFREYDSTWITVFGFSQSDVPLILREFGKCGEIVQFGTFDDGPHCNWLHICYQNKHAAQRALLRSGDQLSKSCMVGVKPMDVVKREAVERSMTSDHMTAKAQTLPRLAGSYRPYQVNASAAQASIVPLPSKSAWEKVSEFILGI